MSLHCASRAGGSDRESTDSGDGQFVDRGCSFEPGDFVQACIVGAAASEVEEQNADDETVRSRGWMTRRRLLITGCALLTAAWGVKALSNRMPSAESPLANGDSVSETLRPVRHAMGETMVSTHPQRVVVLGNQELDSVAALGVHPVGVVHRSNAENVPNYLLFATRSAAFVGTADRPNLVTVASLKPDLILGSRRHEAIYGTLSEIAPTVFTELADGWKHDLRIHSDALNVAAVGEQIIANYDKNMGKLQTEVQDRLRDAQVSVVNARPGEIRAHLTGSFVGRILQEAGISRPASQDKDGISERVSLDRMLDLDGDLMFIMPAATNEMLDHPLWTQLRAVRNNQSFLVDDWLWEDGRGGLAANLILDDIYKSLVDPSQCWCALAGRAPFSEAG
jgi:iron complex transport system substrate-binding protein